MTEDFRNYFLGSFGEDVFSQQTPQSVVTQVGL